MILTGAFVSERKIDVLLVESLDLGKDRTHFFTGPRSSSNLTQVGRHAWAGAWTIKVKCFFLVSPRVPNLQVQLLYD